MSKMEVKSSREFPAGRNNARRIMKWRKNRAGKFYFLRWTSRRENSYMYDRRCKDGERIDTSIDRAVN